MFIIHGRKRARIKQFTNTQESCKSCKSFDLNVKVYKEYYHLFFIPFFPTGEKTFEMRCNNCKEPNRDISLQKHYDETTRAPFYLYSVIILIVGLIGWFVFSNLAAQKEKAKFVAAPEVGDVYRIRKEGRYYFLRLSQIKGDTVRAYHNNLMYLEFVTQLQNEDYFMKEDELVFTKKELKEMLEKAEINSVERGYSDDEGFNRIE